jgi:rare lipoprotein A
MICESTRLTRNLATDCRVLAAKVNNLVQAVESTGMNKQLRHFLPFLLFALLVSGCSSGSSDKSDSSNPTGADTSFFQTGTASWYGAEYQGRPTASGETFDRNAMTAAHKELAFDTWVEVYNLENGYRVRVRINDRGPFVEGRIIDVSEKAAEELGMKVAGLAEVGIKIVSGP